MIDVLVVFAAQTVTAAIPLVFASMGGTLSERSGVATIALEGYLLVGALAAAIGALATGSAVVALGAALVAGAAAGAIFAFTVNTLRASSIVAGVAVNLAAAAGARVALELLYGSASNSPPLLAAAARTGSLERVALLDAILQPTFILAVLAALGVHAFFARTVAGLRTTAAGEHPAACRAQGIDVATVRWRALVAGGAVCALGGAHLTLLQHEFVAFMSGGRGFLALAAVILGGWSPGRVALAAIAIGSLSALDATLAGRGAVPSALLHALPYALTLLAVTVRIGGTRSPRALGTL